MLSQYYPITLRGLGMAVVVTSACSALLMLFAPLPVGLEKLDPLTLRIILVLGLGLFGAVFPLIMVLISPGTLIALKAGVFIFAGRSNAITLSPQVAVPLQDASSLIATVCALTLAVLSLTLYMDRARPGPG